MAYAFCGSNAGAQNLTALETDGCSKRRHEHLGATSYDYDRPWQICQSSADRCQVQLSGAWRQRPEIRLSHVRTALTQHCYAQPENEWVRLPDFYRPGSAGGQSEAARRGGKLLLADWLVCSAGSAGISPMEQVVCESAVEGGGGGMGASGYQRKSQRSSRYRPMKIASSTARSIRRAMLARKTSRSG
jgi:hypothetical protein